MHFYSLACGPISSYRLSVVLDLSLESHIATAGNDRTSLFYGRHFVPTVDTGRELRNWLESGQDPDEISKGLFATLKAEASGIEHVFYLDDWGRQHRADFDRLQLVHRQELVGFCADLRQQILKAA